MPKPFQWLNSIFQSNKRKSVKNVIEQTVQQERTFTQLKQYFIQRLIEGRVQEAEINSKMKYFGYNENFQSISILTLKIDSLENTSFSYDEEDLLLFTINSEVESLIPSDKRLTPIVYKHQQLTFLLNYEDSFKELTIAKRNMATMIQKKIKEALNIPVSIGISKPFTSLLSSQTAYNESVVALKETTETGTESIIFFSDLIIANGKQTINDRQTRNIEEYTEAQNKSISEEIIHIIQEEYDSNLTLESIAQRLQYNPNYLSSIFSKEMNTSFSEYLTQYRINIAKEWLIETDWSIKVISDKLNYNNPQNFIRSFKKIEGITPGKYRKTNKK